MLIVATTAGMIELCNKNNITLLNEMGMLVDVVANFSEGNAIPDEKIEELKKWIVQRGGNYYDFPISRKIRGIFHNYKAYRMILDLIEKKHYLFMHCHTPFGAVIGRLAAHKKNLPVIYTAHGFHFYKGAPLINWMFFYPVEKWLSKYTDVLITINHEDYQLAREKFYAKNTIYIPGIGIDIDKFKSIDGGEDIRNEVCVGPNSGGIEKKNLKRAVIRNSIGVPNEAFMIVSVGEVNRNKNHSVVIKAISKLKNEEIYYVIAGQGKLKDKLVKLANSLGVKERVRFLGYRSDVAELYKSADVCAFPSIREGQGLAAIEGMASGLPLVVADNRGTRDFVTPENGIMCDHYDAEAFANAIRKLYYNPALCNEMKENNKKASDKYDYRLILEQMRIIYKQFSIEEMR